MCRQVRLQLAVTSLTMGCGVDGTITHNYYQTSPHEYMLAESHEGHGAQFETVYVMEEEEEEEEEESKDEEESIVDPLALPPLPGFDIEPNREASLEESIEKDSFEYFRLGALHITLRDIEAMIRLEALGFPAYLVPQAYYACIRHEHLAANFLSPRCFSDSVNFCSAIRLNNKNVGLFG